MTICVHRPLPALLRQIHKQPAHPVADIPTRRDHPIDPGSRRTAHLTGVHWVSHLANPSEEGICALASLYSTKVTASGGRHGSIRSEDGLLDLKLALPRALRGRGDATNPERLFAGDMQPALRTPSFM
jgi:hypothetical protein